MKEIKFIPFALRIRNNRALPKSCTFAMSSVGFILIIDMDQIINGIIDGFFHVSLHD